VSEELPAPTLFSQKTRKKDGAPDGFVELEVSWTKGGPPAHPDGFMELEFSVTKCGAPGKRREKGMGHPDGYVESEFSVAKAGPPAQENSVSS
jgi:hypothetical protein